MSELSKTKMHRKEPKLKDQLDLLRSHSAFPEFLKEVNAITGYGKTVFDPDPCKHSYNSGKQAVGNLINRYLNELEENK